MTSFLDYGVWIFDTLILQILPVVIMLLIAWFIYKCGITGMQTLKEWFAGMFSSIWSK